MSADRIFLNGDIYTGLTPAASQQAHAMAVRDSRIVAIGSDAEVNNLKSSKTQLVDLGGHFVLPGFNDAHVHLAGGGFEKLNVDLAGTKSLDEMQARIAARAQATPAGEWIKGRGWDHTRWPGQKLPTRQDLDAVTGDHPAILARVDGHISIASSRALNAAGITPATQDPAGGKIDRDAAGESTGILRETAQELVKSKIPKVSPAQRRRAIELALQEAAQSGVTSIQDNSSWEDFLVYEELEREHKLTARISEWLPFDEPVTTLLERRARHRCSQANPMLRTGMLKAFLDGSLGSRTAALLAPYGDDPGNSGLTRYDQAELNQKAGERVAADPPFQMGFHAIGDRAVEMALEAIAEMQRVPHPERSEGWGLRGVPPFSQSETVDAGAPPFSRSERVGGGGQTSDLRFRIEHAQVVAPHQFARWRELMVIASVQPRHLLTDMNWAESRLGSARAKSSYPWKTFLDNGIRLAFGSDYPVEPISPFRGLYAAVTRANEAGTKEYFPEQKLTISEAIAAYTTGAAYAEFAEGEKGMLAPGMLADFVVLDRDLTKISPREILGTKVLRTVAGGKTVYER